MANKSLRNVTKKNICTKVTNQNFIHKGMKNSLNPQNICNHSVLNSSL